MDKYLDGLIQLTKHSWQFWLFMESVQMEQQSKSKSTSQKKEIHFHSSFILLSDTPEFWPNKSTDHEKAPCIIRANKNAFTYSMCTIDVAGRALGVSALAVALSNVLGSNSYFMCCKYLFLRSRREGWSTRGERGQICHCVGLWDLQETKGHQTKIIGDQQY